MAAMRPYLGTPFVLRSCASALALLLVTSGTALAGPHKATLIYSASISTTPVNNVIVECRVLNVSDSIVNVKMEIFRATRELGTQLFSSVGPTDIDPLAITGGGGSTPGGLVFCRVTIHGGDANDVRASMDV